jgi:DNA-binding YbaB/EbfC family protein
MNANPFEILKNAQKIQEQMGAIQERLSSIKVTGSSGGGMVEIDLNGRLEMLAVRIGPEAFEEADREMLQDLIRAAFTSAVGKMREHLGREMGAMGLPAGLSW